MSAKPSIPWILTSLAVAAVAGCVETDDPSDVEPGPACEAVPAGDIAPEPQGGPDDDLTGRVEYAEEPDVRTADYQCRIDARTGESTCDRDIVDVSALGRARAPGPGGPSLTAAIDMGTSFRQLDVFALACDPRGWALHVADSPTTNGYGGDAGTTDHDAEGYLYAGGSNTLPSRYLNFYSAFDMVRGVPGSRVVEYEAVRPGCQWVRMTFFHDRVSPTSCFLYQSPTTTTFARTLHGAKLGYPACASATSPQRSIECDWENTSLGDANRWYLGVNRTVGSTARWGSGVTAVVIALHNKATRVPSQCALP